KARDSRQFFRLPGDVSRGSSLFKPSDDARRCLASVMPVMNQAHGRLEIRRVAFESFSEFVTVGAQAIMVAEEIIKLARLILRPERIESFLIDALGLCVSFHGNENRDLFFEQVTLALRVTIFILP